MKFLQLLGKELNKWPQGISAITQDISTSAWGFSSDKALPICNERGFWCSPAGINLGVREIGIDDVALSSDHATAIVTREDWEAERAKLKAPKANGDGWIRHRGGKCPVEAGTLVDVRYRSGVICEGVTALTYHGDDGFESSRSDYLDLAVNWSHTKSDGDIMRYKIHKPAEQPVNQVDPSVVVFDDQICVTTRNDTEFPFKPAVNPIEWRDRIRELDTHLAEVESTYQRQISEITQERESLVQKLAGEGLALVEVVMQPVEDMSYWRNWREGDILTLVDGDISDADFTSGNQYKFLRVDEWDQVVVIDDVGDENGYGVNSGMFKWHSRPAS